MAKHFTYITSEADSPEQAEWFGLWRAQQYFETEDLDVVESHWTYDGELRETVYKITFEEVDPPLMNLVE